MRQRSPSLFFIDSVENFNIFKQRIFVVVSRVDDFFDTIIYTDDYGTLEKAVKIIRETYPCNPSIFPSRQNVFRSPMAVLDTFSERYDAIMFAKSVVRCLSSYYEVNDEGE